MKDLLPYQVFNPTGRTFEEAMGIIEEGLNGPWKWATSKILYVELYRQLVHGYNLTPDDALRVLYGAYRAAKGDT